MKNCSVTPPSKESALSIAVATASPYKLGMWEWSPADMAKHEMLIAEASAPMRSMFDMLAGGEVLTIKGRAVMEMPAGFGTVELGEWVEIQPAMEGWIDCMERIDKELPNRALKQLSRYLGAGLPLTPELVDNARREFDTHLRRMRTMLPSQIKDAAVTAQIAWEFERIKKETEIMNARDNAPTLPAIDGAINAAHGLLLKSGDALSADDVAKALAIKKAEASKQLRELNGLGLLESEPRKGGTMFFRLAVAAPKPEVCDLVQTEGESQTESGTPIDWQAPEMQYLAPEDYELPPADPALLASANRMLSDRLEGVAHALRGCGLPALTDVTGHEDLQMAAAALSGAYQMALAELAAAQHEDSELLDQDRVVVDLRAQIASLTADVMTTRTALTHAINEADRLRVDLAVERQACKTLQEMASTAPVRAATSFIVRAAKRKPRTFSSIEKAREAAMAAIRAGAQRAEVCPMLPPVGVARKGAEWRAA